MFETVQELQDVLDTLTAIAVKGAEYYGEKRLNDFSEETHNLYEAEARTMLLRDTAKETAVSSILGEGTSEELHTHLKVCREFFGDGWDKEFQENILALQDPAVDILLGQGTNPEKVHALMDLGTELACQAINRFSDKDQLEGLTLWRKARISSFTPMAVTELFRHV